MVRNIKSTLALLGALTIPAVPGLAQTTVITRVSRPLDLDGIRGAYGRVLVVVRESESPLTPLPQTSVVLTGRGLDSLRVPPRVGTSRRGGIVRLERVPAGAFLITARRLMYREFNTPITLRAGCEVVIEVYLEPRPICEFDCPQVPGRATVTTCPPDA